VFLQRLRERLVLLLIVLLPFHAFLVTVGTKLIAGSGHAPLPSLVLWKECLLLVILAIGFAEFVRLFRQGSALVRPDILDALIGLFILISIVVTFSTHGDWRLFLYGMKYDVFPLLLFVFLRRLPWSDAWKERAGILLITVGGLFAAYGVTTLLLPPAYFAFLGYSDLHSLYIPSGSLAAFQHIGTLDIRRIQSVMSGPNQFGLWLILPAALLITRLGRTHPENTPAVLRWFSLQYMRKYGMDIVWLLLIVSALFLTFSRSAWVALLCVVIAIASRRTQPTVMRRLLLRIMGMFGLLFLAVLLLQPLSVVRMASSRDHILRPIAAIRSIVAHPWGLGLGTAGPASNRTSDVCVFLPVGGDASWAEGHPELCVFLGEEQVLPIDRECRCPFLPENWYLQIGLESGIVGMLIFLIIIFLVLLRLSGTETAWGTAIFGACIGVSVAAMFLHAWEDSATAYTIWILVATVLIPRIRSYAAGGTALS